MFVSINGLRLGSGLRELECDLDLRKTRIPELANKLFK